jgi:hypothetical protein
MTMMYTQMTADLPIHRDLSPVQPQPQAEQEPAPLPPLYAQDEEPVATCAQGESDTFEVSLDDWFKA